MAVSIEQGRQIVEAAESTGSKLMVAHMKRYDAGNELAKKSIDRFRRSGELGTAVYARVHNFCGEWICGLDTPMDTTDEPMPKGSIVSLPDWLPADYVGQYLNYSQEYCHSTNLLRWFLDAGDDVSVESVSLDDDGFTGIVVFDMNGLRATLETGLLTYFQYDEHTQVYYSDGWIKAWGAPLLHKNLPAKVEVYEGGDVQRFSHPLPNDRWSWSYRREAEAFVRAVLSDEPIRTSGRDTLTDVRLFEEIYRMYLKQRGAL